MEKETVLILLLLKPMAKTSQLNNIAIRIYHGGYPVLNYQFLFLPLFWWKSHERDENEKIVLFLKPMTKTSQLNGKSKENVFRRVPSLK